MPDTLKVDLTLNPEIIPTAEEMLAKGPTKEDEDTLYGLLHVKPGLLCLSDFSDEDCNKCYGRGSQGLNESTGQPFVCDCVFKNFVRGKWYKPERIKARLIRESAQHRAKAGNSQPSAQVAG